MALLSPIPSGIPVARAMRVAMWVPFVLLAVATGMWGPACGVAEAGEITEQEIRAAYLFNFARYVEWPVDSFESATAPIEIGVIASDEFASTLEGTVVGKRIGDRTVRVVRYGTLDEVRDAHVMYISRASGIGAATAIRVFGGRSVFMVSGEPGFARSGGMANFFRTDDKVRFEINERAAREVGLKISSRLLRLAVIVGQRPKAEVERE